MAGIRDEVLYGNNVDFSGSASPSAQVVSDGQLLIGSTASPNIKVGTLTPPASGIAITNASGSITFSLNDDLAAVEGLSGTGLAARTASNTWATRTMQAPAAGFTITNPAGVAGDPTFALSDDLAALEGLSGTGLAARTASNTWATRTMQAPAAGFTITNPAGVAGDPTFALSDDLAAVEGLSGTGIATRTASNTWTTRTITAGTGISVSNGSGVSGNPTITAANWVLLSAQTASSSANIDFTNLSLGSPYRRYVLDFRAVVPATDGATLRMQMSNDNGSTWIVTGYTAGCNTTPYNSATVTNTNSTTDWILSGPLDNGVSTSFANGMIEIYTITANLPYIVGNISFFNNTGTISSFGNVGGRGGSTGANAFRVLMSSGNITSGSFYLYGLQES